MVELNATYLADATVQVGGRATYWSTNRESFMYYQSSEKRWAINRSSSGEGIEDDMVVDALTGGLRGLAYEAAKCTGPRQPWMEYAYGAWSTVHLQIHKLATGRKAPPRTMQVEAIPMPVTPGQHVTDPAAAVASQLAALRSVAQPTSVALGYMEAFSSTPAVSSTAPVAPPQPTVIVTASGVKVMEAPANEEEVLGAHVAAKSTPTTTPCADRSRASQVSDDANFAAKSAEAHGLTAAKASRKRGARRGSGSAAEVPPAAQERAREDANKKNGKNANWGGKRTARGKARAKPAASSLKAEEIALPLSSSKGSAEDKTKAEETFEERKARKKAKKERLKQKIEAKIRKELAEKKKKTASRKQKAEKANDAEIKIEIENVQESSQAETRVKFPRWVSSTLARCELQELQELADADLQLKGPLETSGRAAAGQAQQRTLEFWREAERRQLLPTRMEDLPERLRRGDGSDRSTKFKAGLAKWLVGGQGTVDDKVGTLMFDLLAYLLEKVGGLAAADAASDVRTEELPASGDEAGDSTPPVNTPMML